jgi:endoglucanase
MSALRRSLHHLRLASATVLLSGMILPGISHAQDADWNLFKQRFLLPEGRVMDTGQGGISHSEGQGIAMLLAVHHDDRAAFDSLWQWTCSNLQVRDDKLLAWRWVPGEGVRDKNNATDGDLYVSWALLRAHEKWQQIAYRDAAIAILTDVLGHLIVRDRRGAVLLPGAEGFVKPDGVIVNLSYWIFPAFAELDRALPNPVWNEIAQTGINLLLESHFGRWGLPPDWLVLGEKLEPAKGFTPRFGYDAVRIPLYLLWANNGSNHESKHGPPELLKPFQEFWSYFVGARFTPAWTRLDDDSVDSWNAAPGIQAIARSTLSVSGQNPARLQMLDEQQDYYSAALLLLSKTMLAEMKTR